MGMFSWLRPPVAGPNGQPGVQGGIASPWATTELEKFVYTELVSDTSIYPITRSLIIQLPAYSRGRDIITTTLGRLPLISVDADGNPLTGNTSSFLAQPDPNYPRFQTMAWLTDDLLFYGTAWLRVTSRYAVDSRPRSVERLQPGRVTVTNGQIMVDNQPANVDDLIRIDGPNEGLIARAQVSVRNALALESAAARFAQNPVPAIELHATDSTADLMTKDEISALIQGWVNARNSANGLVAWTPSNVTVNVHGSPAEQLLITGRNQQSIDAARFMGLPADAIDASPSSTNYTYANLDSRLATLQDYGLAQYAAAIESRLSMSDVSPLGTFVKFDFSVLTAPSDSAPDDNPPADSAE